MNKRHIKKKYPEVTQLEVIKIDESGDLTARIVEKKHKQIEDEIVVMPNRKVKPALEPGDVFLGRILVNGSNVSVRPIARLGHKDEPREKLYGVLENIDGRMYIQSAEKNSRQTYLVDKTNGAKAGDFVSFVLSGNRRFKDVNILRSYGKFNLDMASTSLVLDKYEIPSKFDEKVFKETKKLDKYNAAKRLDLTNLPFVTIDGDDSKDFDDAIWAEKCSGGFRLGIAIADVAFYVRNLSEIDREAYRRGNSVYLPNRVVPMLPEVLSNDLCSLCPREKRPVIACFIMIDNEGKMLNYEFHRAVIRSAARLTYSEVQKALDGVKSDNISPVFNTVVKPAYEAYLAMDKARKKRGALELELDEFKVKFDKEGNVKTVEKLPHLKSEQIIEEFMIAANVAAALALKKKKLPVMYRIHDCPKSEKLKDMEGLLKSLKMKIPEETALKPEHFNKILCACEKRGLASGVSDMILRMQCQAQYSPHNIGHFGLGLKDYVHFTSPIRRYSDLLIHRALIKALKLDDGGALDDKADEKLFEDIGNHLCETERKAVSAEREMMARYMSEYLKPAVGQPFDVSISGLSTAGIFVRIDNLGAEGLIPMNSLPRDRYYLPENRLYLEAKGAKKKYKNGDKLTAVLKEANPVNGGMVFRLVGD